MKTKDFSYELPKELIAQTPIEKRDESRMMVVDRKSQSWEHRHFKDIIEYLHPGDVLVINETKVLPARIYGIKEGAQRQVEFLLLERLPSGHWDVILRPGKKLKVGDYVSFGDKLRAEILEKKEDGVVEVSFEYEGIFEEILLEIGQMPLPPYITQKLEDQSRYQTVYARQSGSAAAPTAGLHFTPQLLEEIRQMGVEVVPILLHVGLGTFRPVKTEDILQHHMHSEKYFVSAASAQAIHRAKEEGRRVIAVGTTSVRTLESVWEQLGEGKDLSGSTDIFIYPGYEFHVVDSLITNFHLPESTLIMLVSALMGREFTLRCYEEAVRERYRFFSFGDAMMII